MLAPGQRLCEGAEGPRGGAAAWFDDVGWGLENYGTEPDIEIEIAPQDCMAGRDPQLTKAIEVVLEELAANPVEDPEFPLPPDLAAPNLPSPE